MSGGVTGTTGTTAKGVAAQARAAAGEAARAVPGVAELQPGLIDAFAQLSGRVFADRVPGVTVRVDGTGVFVDVRIAVAPGHQALGVARAVRDAVDAEVRRRTRRKRVHVHVLVTDAR